MNPFNPPIDPTFVLVIVTFGALFLMSLITAMQILHDARKKQEQFRNSLTPGQECRVENYDGKLLYGRIVELRAYGMVIIREFYSNGLHLVTRSKVYMP